MATSTTRSFTNVNVGSAANDGTGDPLRTAFQALNGDFDIAALESPNANVYTAAATLQLSDAGKYVYVDVSSAASLTIPANSSVAFDIGTTIVVVQEGAGTVTVDATNVTLHSPGGTTGSRDLASQYSMATLVKKNTDTWNLQGNLA
jgi:hypothetical protein